jgi:nitrogen fixation/metabolism regulation signal transduction histidine kinase
MEPKTDSGYQTLLSIIHQTPVGVIEMDQQGQISQMNARGVQLLMPFFIQSGLVGDNLLLLFDRFAPQIRASLATSTPSLHPIVNQERFIFHLLQNNVEVERHFWITITKQVLDSFTVFFDDITERYEQEQLFQQVVLEKAVQQGKFEIASGVLHDVGNAVVAFGSYVTRVRRQLDGTDAHHLQNLVSFFEKSQPALASTLGENKAGAIVTLLAGILTNQKNREDETRKALNEQIRIITHIQEIITIQRQYIRDGESRERPKVSVQTILNDCLAMQLALFDNRHVQVALRFQTDYTQISGDRTKLMQVFLNLLKNSHESLERQGSVDKRIEIDVTSDNQFLTVRITDNGAGFEPAVAETLFEKGVSSKPEKSGLGLANCRSIIESHAGYLTLTSPGPGQGATTLVTFPL